MKNSISSIFKNPTHTPCEVVAIGIKPSIQTISEAYKKGIFPWFLPGQIPLWFCPFKRAILNPKMVNIQKSIKPFLKKYEVKFDSNFQEVITNCKKIRENETWISQDLIEIYSILHEKGIAHSVEVYENNSLVGGLYGLIFGKIFCGDSMFSIKPNASKVALIRLCEKLDKFDFLIDCQVLNNHLKFMGATEISKQEFLQILSVKIKEKSGFSEFKSLNLE